MPNQMYEACNVLIFTLGAMDNFFLSWSLKSIPGYKIDHQWKNRNEHLKTHLSFQFGNARKRNW